MKSAGHFHDDTRKACRTLWSWLRRIGMRARVETSHATAAVTAPEHAERCETATVLQFPIRGEALLVKLADQLSRRVDDLAPASGRLWLTLSRHPYLRLSLDVDAYVEFDNATSEFELVMEAPGGTRLILQTSDFDAIVRFVVQYVTERLADHTPLEVAS